MVSAAFKSTCPVEGTRRIGVDAPYGWGSPVEPTSGRGGGTPAGVTSTIVVTVSHITTRRAHRPRCAANAIQTPQAFHRFPGDCGRRWSLASPSTTSVDISNKRRPSGAAASLFPSFTSVNNAVKTVAQTPRPQTSDRTTGVSGRGGRDASIAMGAPSPYISRFSLGLTPFLLARAKEMG